VKALRVLGTLLKYAVLVLVSLGLYGAAAAVYVARTLDAEVDALKAELGPQVEAVRAMKATRPGWAFPSTVYTDWFVLAEGAGYGVQRVAREAVARGYERVTADAPLAPGQLRTQAFMGREVVLFRGEDGVPALMDAYCPHMGAHMGKGGKVCGSALRCPFHPTAHPFPPSHRRLDGVMHRRRRRPARRPDSSAGRRPDSSAGRGRTLPPAGRP
jgi:hypothetical protein